MFLHEYIYTYIFTQLRHSLKSLLHIETNIKLAKSNYTQLNNFKIELYLARYLITKHRYYHLINLFHFVIL